MRRYKLKIVALILLVLSIVDSTVAGLTQSRAMYKSRADWVDLAEDMTKVSDERYEPLEKFVRRVEETIGGRARALEGRPRAGTRRHGVEPR
jgi:hypothetical protein